jgi:prevent-host-death family protein
VARTYAVAEAKAKLSEILRIVRTGRSVTIADRGRPIARLVPIARDDSVEARLERLAERGVLSKARSPGTSIPTVRRSPGALGRFLASRD